MAYTFEGIIDSVKKGNIAPFYFLDGEEPFFIDQIVDLIEETALEESQRAFNQVLIYGKDCGVSDILNQARRFPVMSDRQVVIVKEAQEISDFNKENGIKMMDSYASNPVPTTILVFAYKYKKPDRKHKFQKNLAKSGVHFTSKKIYENQLVSWIENLIRQKGLKASPKAVFLISEHIGMDLSRINNEIDKMRLSLAPGQMIDDELVNKYIGVSREYNVWELQKAFAQRNGAKLMTMQKYIAGNPKAAPMPLITGTLYNFFSKVLLVQAHNLFNTKAIQEKLGLNYFAAPDYLAAAKAYPAAKLRQVFTYLRQADSQSKGVEGGDIKDHEILKELILKIIY